jgi:hypothetical protein
MIRPPFPRAINNSLLSAFRACPRKAELEFFHHWKPGTESVHLHAGKAFASGLEASRRAYYEQKLPVPQAVALGTAALLESYGEFECPEHIAKTPSRMAGALLFYFDNYPLETDPCEPYQWAVGKRAIEFSFATPLSIGHPETGEPLIYAGRSDMIVKMAGGLFVEDDKTASSLGASWSNSFDMRAQFTGYCWSAREAGLAVDGVLVRGVSILKSKYETQQVITYRRPWEIDRWLEQTERDIKRLIEMWKLGAYDYNLDASCEAYGGCVFKRVCMSQDPAPWLEGYFTRRRRDSLDLSETIIGAEEVASWEKT